MSALNLNHFLVIAAGRNREPICQVIVTVKDADLLHVQPKPEVNYFASKIDALEWSAARRACRFYDVQHVEWSAQAVQDAYAKAAAEVQQNHTPAPLI